jgi:hypothetical protein
MTLPNDEQEADRIRCERVDNTVERERLITNLVEALELRKYPAGCYCASHPHVKWHAAYCEKAVKAINQAKGIWA